jgi:hypothetical protein
MSRIAVTTRSGSSNWIQWPLFVATMWRPRDERSASRRCCSKCIRSLIAARDHQERQIRQRDHAINRGCRLFEHCEMIRHRPKAFRLTPERLHDGCRSGGSFRTSPTNRSRVRAAVGPKTRTNLRGMPCARPPTGRDTPARHRLAPGARRRVTAECHRAADAPVVGSSDAIHSADRATPGRRCRQGAPMRRRTPKRAKGMADQHRRSIARRIGENSTQLGHHPGDRARSSSWIAPAQASAIVGARTREGRDVRASRAPSSGTRPRYRTRRERRPAIAGTDQMQMLSADVDHDAGRRVQPCAASSTNELVHDTCREAYRRACFRSR